MKLDWIKNLKTPQEKEAFRREFESAQKVLDRLEEILYNYIRESESIVDDYDSPSWAYRAADVNGQRKALKKVISLIKAKDQDA
jgi:hypothetical protein